MHLKYGEEVELEHESVDTLKDEQVIEGSNAMLTRNLQRLEHIGRRKQYKSAMKDPLGIKFKKP